MGRRGAGESQPRRRGAEPPADFPERLGPTGRRGHAGGGQHDPAVVRTGRQFADLAAAGPGDGDGTLSGSTFTSVQTQRKRP